MVIQSRAIRTIPSLSNDSWWHAVQARDPLYDGHFVYAVLSTGIYCRPTCPSRRPGREQVLFFGVPEVAQQAGFRPCMRCKPTLEAGDAHVALVRRTCTAIEQSEDSMPTLASLGAAMSVHPHHLHRTFKRLTGITPHQYADACRVARLRERLKAGSSVTDALYEAGYGSSSRLYEGAAARLGMKPATYKRGGHGMTIHYTVTACRLGLILVAATDRGICAVSLGNDLRELEAALLLEYPRAVITRQDATLQIWVNDLLEHLDGHTPHLNLPLDVQATAFQRRVWEHLQTIPYGTTRTYSEIARALGQPTATRAVARACATNPVSVVVPCHRVVREDGHLGGYRWGLQRKEALLAQERDIAATSASSSTVKEEEQRMADTG